MSDFLLLTSLFVHNPPDADPSFLTTRGETELRGWPDLTISTVALGNDISDWHVSDDASLSDHLYIKFKVKSFKNIDHQRHGLQTKTGKHAKFDNKIKKLKNKYIKEIQRVTTADQLDSVTLRLQNEITLIALSCYKKKCTPKVTAPPWWSNEVKAARNKVRTLRRRYQHQPDENLKQQQHIHYKKEKASLKKLIRETKS